MTQDVEEYHLETLKLGNFLALLIHRRLIPTAPPMMRRHMLSAFFYLFITISEWQDDRKVIVRILRRLEKLSRESVRLASRRRFFCMELLVLWGPRRNEKYFTGIVAKLQFI